MRKKMEKMKIIKNEKKNGKMKIVKNVKKLKKNDLYSIYNTKKGGLYVPLEKGQ